MGGMDALLKIGKFVWGVSGGPNDLSDRIAFQYSSLLLVAFSGITSLKLYVFRPIQCWVPAEFNEPWEEYSENYCWISNTYFLAVGKSLPEEAAQRYKNMIGYYQWVPFVLLLQCIPCLAPCWFWKVLSHRVGVNLNALLQCASEARAGQGEEREKGITFIARYIEDVLYRQRGRLRRELYTNKPRARTCLHIGRTGGNYLVLVYFFIKLLYAANSAGQMYLISVFTGANTNYSGSPLFGFELLRDVLIDATGGTEGTPLWRQTGLFPRVTFCDFEVLRVGQPHKYTIFLWFWFAVALAATSLSIFVWLWRMILPRVRRQFVAKFLKFSGSLASGDKKALLHFSERWLCWDGVFLMHMIADKSGDIVCGEVISFMFVRFKHYSYSRGAKPGHVSPTKLFANGSDGHPTPSLPDSEMQTIFMDRADGGHHFHHSSKFK